MLVFCKQLTALLIIMYLTVTFCDDFISCTKLPNIHISNASKTKILQK